MLRHATTEDVRAWRCLEVVMWQGERAMVVIPGMLRLLRVGEISQGLFIGVQKGIFNIGSARKFDGDRLTNGNRFLIPIGEITHEVGRIFWGDERDISVLNLNHE